MTVPAATTSGAQPPPFSYAQAAKGKSVASTSVHAATPDHHPLQAGDRTSKESVVGSFEVTNGNWADDAADAATVVEEQPSAVANGERSIQSPAIEGLVNGALNSASSYTTSTDVDASQSTSTAKDEDAPTPITPDPEELPWRRRSSEKDDFSSQWRNSDKQNQSRKEQPEAEASKASSLVQAPVPTVNVWAQRAQEAKSKQIHPFSQQASLKGSAPKSVAPVVKGVRSSSAPGHDEIYDKPPPAPGPQDDSAFSTSREARRMSGPRGARPRNNAAASNEIGRRLSRQGSLSNGSQFPSLQDSISWPTPETAQDGDRKKAQVKSNEIKDTEKPVTVSGKSHGKNEWKHVPFVPTVKFETPMATRGRGGARGGARGGRDSAGRGSLGIGANGARGIVTSSGDHTRTAPPRDRSPGTNRASSLPRSGRFANGTEEQQSGGKRTSLPNNVPNTLLDAAKDSSTFSEQGTSFMKPHSMGETLSLERPPANEYAACGSVVQLESLINGPAKHTENKSRRRPSRAADYQDPTSSQHSERERKRSGSLSSNIKSNWLDRRAENASRLSEMGKESVNSSFTRERGEGRSERGRGGRNRGHYHSHPPANIQIATSQPWLSPQPHSAKSATFQTTFPGRSGYSRGGGRGSGNNGGPRSASIPTDVSFARFAVPYAGPVYFPQNQYTSPTSYDSSAPVTPSGGMLPVMNMMLMNGVAAQLTYYFSVDNLCKDMFLRERMDSQGFVSLRLIANFTRMKSMTSDFELIKSVAQSNPELEVFITSNGDLLVRKREGWASFVLAMNARDPSAQNDGPTLPQYFSPPMQVNGYDPHAMFHSHFAGFTPMPTATPVNIYSSPPNNRYSMSAIDSRVNFDPSTLPPPTPGSQSGIYDNNEEEPDAYPDDKINNELTILTRFRPDQLPPPSVSRSFSNGTIEGGVRSPNEHSIGQRSRSPAVVSDSDASDRTAKLAEIKEKLSSPAPGHRNAHSGSQSTAVFWIKDQTQAVELPPEAMPLYYVQVYNNAKHQRRTTEPGRCPSDMMLLYDFWSHFLIRNFNKKMYVDFKSFAMEDATFGSRLGMDHLLEYYSKALFSSDWPIRKSVAQDFVDQAREERSQEEGAAFKRLRSAWRNGKMNLKSRKILQDVMDPGLKSSLDR